MGRQDRAVGFHYLFRKYRRIESTLSRVVEFYYLFREYRRIESALVWD